MESSSAPPNVERFDVACCRDVISRDYGTSEAAFMCTGNLQLLTLQ